MKKIKELFNKYGIEINEMQIEQFDKYFKNLIETNKVLNLTAITEENDVLVKHFLDSVLPIKLFKEKSTIVDVGTGAGFPALPIKIIRPDLKITMVDSLNKRITFLNSVIKENDLKEIHAIHARAEDFAKNNREKYDYAVARAVAQLNTLVEYLLPLIKVGGQAIIYKSSKIEEEVLNAKNAINILGGKIQKIHQFDLEGLERNILVIKKIKETPKKYPRDKNKPKLLPIV